MSNQQLINRILNCFPSKDTENDWQFENFENAGIINTDKEVPETKDNREEWWKINNQGETGSCVGWATADGVLRWHFVKLNRIDKEELLSPKFIWMASKETDDYTDMPTTFIDEAGTSIKQALIIAKKYGCVKDQMLPFESEKLYEGKIGEFYANANKFRIDSFVPLRNTIQMKFWLAFEGPILTRLDIDKSWWNLLNDKSGNLDTYYQPDLPAGHAVAIVGYTKDRFIIRNSWGTEWGDKGFGYASKEYVENAFTLKGGSNEKKILDAYGVKVY
jgi:hypothetical protein